MLIKPELLLLLVNGIVATKISSSLNKGSPPPLYILVYFAIFLIPEPNSSARPISLKKPAILGFLGYGE